LIRPCTIGRDEDILSLHKIAQTLFIFKYTASIIRHKIVRFGD
jgi:hypothetical protein